MRTKNTLDLIRAYLLKVGSGFLAILAFISRLAIPLLIISIPLIVFDIKTHDLPKWVQDLWNFKVIQMLTDFILMCVGAYFFYLLWEWRTRISKIGKQYKARGLSDDILNRKKPKILYLRSFELDIMGGEDVEIILTQALAPWGDLIAIGRPEEELPTLGAARMYIRSGDWKQRAETEFSTATLIIVHVGVASPGLWWEFERVITTVAPEKILLFVCGTEREAYNDFNSKLNSELRIHLPPYNELTRPPVLLNPTPRPPLGFFTFDSNWNARFLQIEDPSTEPKMVRLALEPVFHALKIPRFRRWKPW